MVEMDHEVSCELCQRSEETKITGPLSTKDHITAHQNCLLFSSGIYCKNSPEFDDLFGFSTEDVRKELNRGKKLTCNKCKKKGATAGCEVKRCKKSYHYPCAVQEGAHIVEEEDRGKYGLYCLKHYEKLQRNSEHDSSTDHRTSKKSSETASSKVYCLACEKTEGNISLDSLSNNIIMLYCDKHAPLSHKRNGFDDSAVARPSVVSSDSDSDSASSMTHVSLKRQLSFSDKEEAMPSKRTDENEPNSEMAMFAPLESDLDESGNSLPEHQLISEDTDNEIPNGSGSGNQLMDDSGDGNEDEDETIIHSGAESKTLLFPVTICMDSGSTTSTSLSNQIQSPAHPSVILVNVVEGIKSGDEQLQMQFGDKMNFSKRSSPEQNPGNSPQYVHSTGQHAAAPSVPPQSSPVSPLSPDCSKPRIASRSSRCTSSDVSQAPPETFCVSHLSSPSPPRAVSSDPVASIDSTNFWRSCNAAGCTEAIFTDFIDQMNDISSRIQSDQASQEDYDLALKVMAASGKLAELVAKQQKELEKKQTQLQKAAEAMQKVVR